MVLSARHSGTVFVLLAAVLYSTGGLCMKLIPWSGVELNGGRCTIALAVYLVYLLVKRHVRAGIEEMSQRALLTKLAPNGIGYVKLKLMIRVFQELNLLGIEEIAEDFYHFHLYSFTTNIDLKKSNILRRLRCQRRTTETI